MARSVYILPVFMFSTLWLIILAQIAPKAPGNEKDSIRFPTSFDDLQKLSLLFKSYLKTNEMYTYVLFSSAYLYKQAFCIPGSALLNILGGAIFGLWPALPLCCLLTGIGATLSYLLSKTFAMCLVTYYWPNEVSYLKYKIESHGNNLQYYLLSLRVMPLTPNWLLNLISPIVGVPLYLFFITVFFGLIPYNYICVQSGAVLASVSSLNDVFTWKIFVQLSGLAFAMFILPKVLS